MEVESILYDVGNDVATIALNRPDRLSGVSPPGTSEPRRRGGSHAFPEKPTGGAAVSLRANRRWADR